MTLPTEQAIGPVELQDGSKLCIGIDRSNGVNTNSIVRRNAKGTYDVLAVTTKSENRLMPVYGIPSPLPELVELPGGIKQAKMRFREGEFATITIRYHGYELCSQYLLVFMDDEKHTMTPGPIIATNSAAGDKDFLCRLKRIVLAATKTTAQEVKP